ncbi:MAG: putative ABC transporter permease [Candidatus Hydrogenedentes bacterium]|nr:putative ABC transporter permease [Candidatus Hydrogenedentota bacterium]
MQEKNPKRVLIRFFIFALLGLNMEVFFTSISGLITNGNFSLRGHTSLWMMLDYGLLGILTPWIRDFLLRRKIPLVGRAVVYMCGIYLVEYLSGILFHKVIGLNIWDYSSLPLNLHGQITLVYLPLWFALGLGIETLYEWVDRIAVLFSNRVSG